MMYLATAILALIAGLLLGWFGHRRAWTWCVRCGRAIGSKCVECRNRERTVNLHRPSRECVAEMVKLVTPGSLRQA